MSIEERARIAHHEAAHVVIAMAMGMAAPKSGMDIDLENEVSGGVGSVQVGLEFLEDLRGMSGDDLANAQDQQTDAARHNLCTILAGAACDAKLLGEDPWGALEQQPGDHCSAVAMLDLMAIDPEERDVALKAQLADACAALDEHHLWDAVEAVAAEALATGIVDPDRLEEIVRPRLDRWQSNER